MMLNGEGDRVDDAKTDCLEMGEREIQMGGKGDTNRWI
jgi:hypothetical protein